MKIEKPGKVVVFADGSIVVSDWAVIGGSVPQLRRDAIRKAFWILFKAWLYI